MGTLRPTATAVSLIASLHRAHEVRLDRVAAVRRARVAFVSPELGPDAVEALVGRCRGRVVALSERPDLIVVPSGRHLALGPARRAGSRVVDTREFLAMHRAVVETGNVSMLRLAARGARLRLEETVRLRGRLSAATAPRAPEPPVRRSTRMRTGSEGEAAGPRDVERQAHAESLARRIDGVVHDLRAADPAARLLRR